MKAMCSSEGITAAIEFDRAFGGKIYSLDYANVHECIYYNGRDLDTVLFSIPVHRCGTKLSRNTRDVRPCLVSLLLHIREVSAGQWVHPRRRSFSHFRSPQGSALSIWSLAATSNRAIALLLFEHRKGGGSKRLRGEAGH